MKCHKVSCKLTESFSRQLNAYALAAGAAGVSALALSNFAEAKIIYTPAHIPIPVQSYVRLGFDSTAWFSFRDKSDDGQYSSWGNLKFAPQTNGIGAVASKGLAPALRAGQPVGHKQNFSASVLLASSVFYSNRKHGSGLWWNDGRGEKDRYLGVKFEISGKVHYGWARLNVKPGRRITGLITGFAYETVPNKTIITGETTGPNVVTAKPATLGYLALGRK